jgi:amino acid adenylation domain-containing protein
MTVSMLVHQFLEHSADRLPDKTALVCDGQRLTYAELDARANRLANALRAVGFRRGDRAVIFLPNSVEAVVGIFAVMKAGGVFVVANFSTKEAKLAYILTNSGATALITAGRHRAMAGRLKAIAPALHTVILAGPQPEAAAEAGFLAYEQVQSEGSPERPAPVNIDLDLACLIYTSGSTGEPKGVMSDHSNVVFATGSIISYLENREDDIVIGLLPLSFDYGLYQLLMVMRFGGTLVLEKGFTYPAAALKRIEEERVTGLPGVPTIFAMLLKLDLAAYDLSSLRYITNTAAALPPSHVLALGDAFPWARLYSMYGLTETKRTLYLPPSLVEQHPDSVGIAIPGTEVWVEDEAGNRLGPGAVGELVVRGRHVMRGYWQAPEATAQRYRPGPLPGERVCYSGDLFRMDEEGLFYFVARKDDIIKSRGEKVAPKEVEAVLYALEGVVEAAVIGVPDPVLGQAIVAFIAPTPGRELTEAAVLAHCRTNLEDYMMPKYVEFRPELPKTESGKISHRSLKEAMDLHRRGDS